MVPWSAAKHLNRVEYTVSERVSAGGWEYRACRCTNVSPNNYLNSIELCDGCATVTTNLIRQRDLLITVSSVFELAKMMCLFSTWQSSFLVDLNDWSRLRAARALGRVLCES